MEMLRPTRVPSLTKSQRMMKISVITDISVLRFYGYIGYIIDILTDILEKNIDKPKINQNL